MSNDTTEALESNTYSVINCDSLMDIAKASNFHATLQAALANEKNVLIHGSAVERVDTSILQLLCAFIQDLKALGLTVKWEKPSQALEESAQLLGLTEVLLLN